MKPSSALALVALVLAGCGGGGQPPAEAQAEARRLVALSERWVNAAGPSIVRATDHLTRSFNECSLVRVPGGGAELPSEAELWPEWPAATYQAAAPFYAEFARKVRGLHLRDPRFRGLEDATARIAAYLQRFRGVRPDACATLRKWAQVGFDRPFDVAAAIGVPEGSFGKGTRPPASLLRAETTIRQAETRMARLGLSEVAVKRFWLGADPLLYGASR